MASHMNDNDALIRAFRISNSEVERAEKSEERKIIEECMKDGDYWWCGWCRSLIPQGYWHFCNDTVSRSGPSDRTKPPG
jgi:hypothetical protein